jgi:drug/metabolite transporter (DMT)-like permease
MNGLFWIKLTHSLSVLFTAGAVLALFGVGVEFIIASDNNREVRRWVPITSAVLAVGLALGSVFCYAYSASHEKPTACEKESK